MSYTDLLESKHHYLMILKDADTSRRNIERNFTPDKADEYNKIMAVRNTAFINLIKENVPFVEVDDKDAIRIKIDDANYDMKKEKLRAIVGEAAYEQIIQRSHEHESILNYMEQNKISGPSDTSPVMPDKYFKMANFDSSVEQLPGNNPSMYSNQMMSVPMMTPYGMVMYPQPVIPQDATSQENADMFEKLNNKLNDIVQKMQPTVKEVVIDEKLKEELSSAKKELDHAKQQSLIEKERADSAYETIKNVEESFNAEKIQHEILMGNFETITAERDSLVKKLDAAQKKAVQEKTELHNKVEELTQINRMIIEENNSVKKNQEEVSQIFKKKQKALEEQLKAERNIAENKIAQVNDEKIKEIEKIKNSFAEKDKEYQSKLNESYKKMEALKEQMSSEKELQKNDLEREIQTLQGQIAKYKEESDTSRVLEDKIEQLSKEYEEKIAHIQEEAEERIALLKQEKIINENSPDEKVEKLMKECQEKSEGLSLANEKITEVKAQVKQLEGALKVMKEMAFHDKLTGLKNKNAFNDIYKNEINGDHVFIMLSINGMREFNKKGRPYGDRILKFVGQSIEEEFGELSFRLMSDLFCVILKNADENFALTKVSNFVQHLHDDNFIFIPYGICSTNENGDKKQITDIAEQRMNKMRMENKKMLSKELSEQQQKELLEKERREVEKNNNSDNFINYSSLSLIDGEIVINDVLQEDTIVNYFSDEEDEE